MSIYATLWRLKFPSDGDDYLGCDWVEVIAQGVPAHIGSPTPGCGYEDGDPYAEFLPPALHTDENGEHEYLRAVVFVKAGTPKGTARSGQEYSSTLLVCTGEEYAAMTFQTLYERICEALRGGRPRLVAQVLTPDGRLELIHEEESLSEGKVREDN
jgi:hypothetical protein